MPRLAVTRPQSYRRDFAHASTQFRDLPLRGGGGEVVLCMSPSPELSAFEGPQPTTERGLRERSNTSRRYRREGVGDRTGDGYRRVGE